MNKKAIIKAVIQFTISVLTAALTAMGTTNCIGHKPIENIKYENNKYNNAALLCHEVEHTLHLC